MSLKKAIDNLKFDVRMQESNMKSGKLNESELNGYFSGLEDLSDKATYMTFSEEGEEIVEETPETVPEPSVVTNPENMNGGGYNPGY